MSQDIGIPGCQTARDSETGSFEWSVDPGAPSRLLTATTNGMDANYDIAVDAPSPHLMISFPHAFPTQTQLGVYAGDILLLAVLQIKSHSLSPEGKSAIVTSATGSRWSARYPRRAAEAKVRMHPLKTTTTATQAVSCLPFFLPLALPLRMPAC